MIVSLQYKKSFVPITSSPALDEDGVLLVRWSYSICAETDAGWDDDSEEDVAFLSSLPSINGIAILPRVLAWMEAGPEVRTPEPDPKGRKWKFCTATELVVEMRPELAKYKIGKGRLIPYIGAGPAKESEKPRRRNPNRMVFRQAGDQWLREGETQYVSELKLPGRWFMSALCNTLPVDVILNPDEAIVYQLSSTPDASVYDVEADPWHIAHLQTSSTVAMQWTHRILCHEPPIVIAQRVGFSRVYAVSLGTWAQFYKSGSADVLTPILYGDSELLTDGEALWWRGIDEDTWDWEEDEALAPAASWMQPDYDSDSNTYWRLSRVSARKGMLYGSLYCDMKGRKWYIGRRSAKPTSEGLLGDGTAWYLVRDKKVQKAILSCETAGAHEAIRF